MPLISSSPSSISPFLSSVSGKLTVREETVGADFSIPNEITELEFYNVHFTDYPLIPAHVRSLLFERCEFDTHVAFHEGLERLHLGLQSPFQMELPSTLFALSIRKCRFPVFPALSENVKVLRLLRCNSPPPAAFPEGLRRLAVLDCRWPRLPPFPSSLEELVLDELELDTLPPIPPTTHYREGELYVQDRPPVVD